MLPSPPFDLSVRTIHPRRIAENNAGLCFSPYVNTGLKAIKHSCCAITETQCISNRVFSLLYILLFFFFLLAAFSFSWIYTVFIIVRNSRLGTKRVYVSVERHETRAEFRFFQQPRDSHREWRVAKDEERDWAQAFEGVGVSRGGGDESRWLPQEMSERTTNKYRVYFFRIDFLLFVSNFERILSNDGALLGLKISFACEGGSDSSFPSSILHASVQSNAIYIYISDHVFVRWNFSRDYRFSCFLLKLRFGTVFGQSLNALIQYARTAWMTDDSSSVNGTNTPDRSAPGGER